MVGRLFVIGPCALKYDLFAWVFAFRPKILLNTLDIFSTKPAPSNTLRAKGAAIVLASFAPSSNSSNFHMMPQHWAMQIPEMTPVREAKMEKTKKDTSIYRVIPMGGTTSIKSAGSTNEGPFLKLQSWRAPPLLHHHARLVLPNHSRLCLLPQRVFSVEF